MMAVVFGTTGFRAADLIKKLIHSDVPAEMRAIALPADVTESATRS